MSESAHETAREPLGSGRPAAGPEPAGPQSARWQPAYHGGPTTPPTLAPTDAPARATVHLSERSRAGDAPGATTPNRTASVSSSTGNWIVLAGLALLAALIATAAAAADDTPDALAPGEPSSAVADLHAPGASMPQLLRPPTEQGAPTSTPAEPTRPATGIAPPPAHRPAQGATQAGERRVSSRSAGSPESELGADFRNGAASRNGADPDARGEEDDRHDPRDEHGTAEDDYGADGRRPGDAEHDADDTDGTDDTDDTEDAVTGALVGDAETIRLGDSGLQLDLLGVLE